MSPVLMQLLLLLAAGAVAWLLALGATRLASSWSTLPGHGRPRTAGVGVVIALVVTTALTVIFSESIHSWAGLEEDAIPTRRAAGFILLMLGAFFIGWLDDRRFVPRIVTVALLLGLALLTATMDLHLRQIALPRLGPLDPPWIWGVALAAIWLLLTMLAINFFDTMDGFVGRQTNWLALSLLFCTVNAAWRFDIALVAAALLGLSIALLSQKSVPGEQRPILGNSGGFALGGALGGVLLLLVADDLRFASERAYHNNLLTAGLILSLPIYDFGRTMVGRVAHGRPLFGSQRDGLIRRHQRAVEGNWAETINVVEPFLITFAILGAVGTRFDNPSAPSSERIVLTVLLAATACTIFRLKVRRAEYKAAEGE